MLWWSCIGGYKDSVGVYNERINGLFAKNKTWDLCKLPAAKRALQNKWVYRLKEDVEVRKYLKTS